jgi:hypothetical protein
MSGTCWPPQSLADQNPEEGSYPKWLKRRPDEKMTKVAWKRVAALMGALA